MIKASEIIGLVAGFLTTSGYIPQIYVVIKRGSASGLSGLFLIVMSVGISLWLIYGFLINSLSIILANGFSLLCLMVLSFYKIKDLINNH